MPPSEVGEACEAPVKGDPLAAVFESESGVVGVGDEIAARLGLKAEIYENLPVRGAGSQEMNFISQAEILQKFQSLRKRRGFFENLWMGDDPKEPAQHEIRHGHANRLLQCCLDPVFELDMALRILPMDMDQNIHVQEDHWPSMISRRPAEDAKSTPGCSPDPRNVFNGRVRTDPVDFDRDASVTRKASSITSPNEQFLASEASLAR